VNGNGPAFAGTLNGFTSPSVNGRVVDFGKIKAYDYFDLSLRFSVGDHLELFATASNLLDKQPPVVGTGVGVTSFNSGNTFPSTYDALGRAYAITAKIKF
jgi:iron complex outermembrane recepter protein